MKTRKYLLWVAVAGVAYLLLAALVSEIRDPDAQPEASRGTSGQGPSPTLGLARTAGREFAQDLVPGALKDPDSATFPLDSVRAEALAISDDVDFFRVRGDVVARNAVGAKVRTPWEALIFHAEKTWVPVSIALDDREVWRNPAALGP